jgi:hypothetical protein
LVSLKIIKRLRKTYNIYVFNETVSDNSCKRWF